MKEHPNVVPLVTRAELAERARDAECGRLLAIVYSCDEMLDHFPDCEGKSDIWLALCIFRDHLRAPDGDLYMIGIEVERLQDALERLRIIQADYTARVRAAIFKANTATKAAEVAVRRAAIHLVTADATAGE